MKTNLKNIPSSAKELIEANPRTFNLDKRYVTGTSGAGSFLTESMGARTFDYTVTNKTGSDVTMIVGTPLLSIFSDEAEFFAAIGAEDNNFILQDGTLVDDGEVPANPTLTVTSNSGRSVTQMQRYFASVPTRLLGLSLQSSKIDGSAETTNFSQHLAAYWVSPFRKSAEEHLLNLREFTDNRANSPEYLNINFQQLGFPALVSNEHFITMVVKNGTQLNFSWKVGFQSSNAQEFRNGIKKGDEGLREIARM